jgi:hypothetical protein
MDGNPIEYYYSIVERETVELSTYITNEYQYYRMKFDIIGILRYNIILRIPWL